MLWGGQVVAYAGSQLTTIALPAAVVVLLGASPMQSGALQAVECGIIPVLAMLAGVIVDRLPSRPLMIGANVARGLALASLPVAFVLHHLTLAQFFAVSAVVGIASVVFDTAYAAFFPALIGRERLAEGNATMAMGASGAEAAGASLAGFAVSLVGAPFAMAFNAATHLISAATLARIRHQEVRSASAPATFSLLGRELADGARALNGDPVLRSIALTNAMSYFGGAVVMSVFYIFLYRRLNVTPFAVGLIVGTANLGIGGAFFAERIARRFGMRRTLAGAVAIAGSANVLLPLLAPLAPVVTIVAARLLLTLCGPIVEVNEQTLRASRVAPELRGRLSATIRTIVWGALPLGALTGGYLGTAIGIVPTMFVGGAIAVAAALWMLGCPPIASTDASTRRPIALTPGEVLPATAPVTELVPRTGTSACTDGGHVPAQ